MEHRGNRTILALTLLVVVWIVTYWIWQPRSERDPRVTFPEPLTNTGVQVSPDIPALIPKQPSPQPLPDRPRAIDPEPPKPQTQPQNPDFGEPPFRWYTVQPNDTAERIAARDAFEFFAGLRNGRPQWNKDVKGKRAVFEDRANGVGWVSSVSYNAGLARYILMVDHTRSSRGNLGVYDAPEPWPGG